MATIEKESWSLNGCRFVDWKHPNEGYEAFKDVVDLFISTAIDDIVAEYRGEHLEWLEITESGPVISDDGDYRELAVMPTQDGPFGDGDTRLHYRLWAKLWEDELPEPEAKVADWDAVGLRFWDIIAECLTSERSYIALARARKTYRMRLAAYAYDAAEGSHYLPNLVDPEFNKQYQHYLKNRGR